MTEINTVQREALVEFETQFGSLNDTFLAWAPGRVNLIGEHTDYNDGFVLPMPIDRGVAVVLRPRYDLTSQFYSGNLDELAVVDVHNVRHDSVPIWARYCGGVVDALYDNENKVTGVDAVIKGNIPLGGGLSSSAALETAVSMAVQQAFGLSISAVDMALLCQMVEQRYADVQCGVMDQFACRLGQSNSAVFLDCRTLRHETISLELGNQQLIVVDTKVRRRLENSAFNTRVEQCKDAVKSFQKAGHRVESLRDVDEKMLLDMKNSMCETIFRRCRHVVMENARVEATVTNIRRNDFAEVGRLFFASHQSLQLDYEVTCPELDFVVDAASNSEGVAGARMTGAGFGGNAIVLVDSNCRDKFEENLVSNYFDRFAVLPGIEAVGVAQAAFAAPTDDLCTAASNGKRRIQ